MHLKTFLCSALFASPALLLAESSSYSITADFPYVSDYVFRGIQYADDSIQPSLQFSAGGFHAGLWTNQPVKGGYDNEFDYSMGYNVTLSDQWSMDVGFTYYDYPETAGNTEQFEPYVALTASWANGLSSTTTLFYETEYEVTTLSTALSYSYDLGGSTSLDLSGELGGVMPSGADDYTYWALTSQLTAALTDQAAAYLGVTYSNTDMDHVLNPEGDDVFTFKAGISLGF